MPRYQDYYRRKNWCRLYPFQKVDHLKLRLKFRVSNFRVPVILQLEVPPPMFGLVIPAPGQLFLKAELCYFQPQVLFSQLVLNISSKAFVKGWRVAEEPPHGLIFLIEFWREKASEEL